ncbi:DUF2071 domain-containing protein [Sphingobacterium sp. UT-1RO-CII-1]|uniref:YqjF family protein n=1 Tax=Sphingobacterium sp. UT-1RO-CII-1 TaxID=2995225 RepID=UPI00227AD4D2|nr:DUF2071 domain-containing protein [Sphingobacterium sp. UT-1RO-CII-1]MCY4780771.1 DUF2071 domain-containing protein [Sphingobacterium sp. UT-1RO-CII-1]
MKKIAEILKQNKHRDFPYPTGKWLYYQEWNRVLFLHWEVSYDALRALVPQDLHIDTFNGKAYISIVPFTMEKIRPRYLPSVKAISDFDEINVRTYINNNGKRGVYFLNIEAGKSISALVARTLSGLPYEKAIIHREQGKFTSINPYKGFQLAATYSIGNLKKEKTKLDRWLTERYCLYLDKKDRLYRYDIHHLEWEIQKLALHNLNIDYKIGELHFKNSPDLCHYSKGVEVLAWNAINIPIARKSEI